MKAKLFIVLVLLLASCKLEKPADTYYRDFELKIVSINGETMLSEDKFHKPQTCNMILFETTYDFERKFNTNHLYREINTCRDRIADKSCGCEGFHIDTKWFYNHKVGDKVHFDYMLKENFFEINNR